MRECVCGTWRRVYAVGNDELEAVACATNPRGGGRVEVTPALNIRLALSWARQSLKAEPRLWPSVLHCTFWGS